MLSLTDLKTMLYFTKGKLGDTVEKILGDPISEVFPDVKIRGVQGRGYYTPNYGEHRAFIGMVLWYNY